jgi:hypothetical protein
MRDDLMGEFLLLGPVSKDTIIRNNKKKHAIGGAVYYQSKVLSCLGINHTVVVTLSKEDKDILNHFPSDTNILPIFKKETVKFENHYPDINQPNLRIQRSNAPEIPITPEDISKVFSGKVDFESVLLGPLLPTDLPFETVQYLFERNISIYLGAQGYLREFEECNLQLRPIENLKKILKMVKILFLDEKESMAFFEVKESEDLSVHDRGKYLVSIGPELVVITCGDKGSYIYSQKDQKGQKIKAYPPVKLRDPTGLGDTYMAAYLSCKQIISHPMDCGNFAAMVSTIKLESKKGFNKDWDYVQNRLDEV